MKPKNLLVYYGWLNSFNSATNSWTNEKVAQELAKYHLLVIGDGIQSSSHGDYSNTQSILPRVKALNPDVQIFGYVTVNQTFSNFKTKVDEWKTLDIDGIFMDEAGYDYGTATTNSREAFNAKVDYIHSNEMICFANAWKAQYILGTENDASYPNTTWNPNAMESNLTSIDWCLIESFAIKSDASFETKTDWKARGDEWKEYQALYGINLAGNSVISDSDANGQDKMDFIYTSASIYSLDAVGSSDTSYGASSAKSKFWNRPDVSKLGLTFDDAPVVVNCASDSDVYMRYVDYGLMKIDFSSGSESSSITEY